jgi:hypothetical protein
MLSLESRRPSRCEYAGFRVLHQPAIASVDRAAVVTFITPVGRNSRRIWAGMQEMSKRGEVRASGGQAIFLYRTKPNDPAKNATGKR